MPYPRLWCVSGTILGFFVVPDVCSTSARSLGRVGSAVGGVGTSAPDSVKRPTVVLDGVSSITGMPAWAQQPFTMVAFSSPASVIIAAAGRSVSSNCTSAIVRFGLSGAKTQRPARAQKHTAASGPLGIDVQITISRVNPKRARSMDVTNSLSAENVRACLPVLASEA